jgi:arylformamidase
MARPRPAVRLADGTYDVTVALAPETPPWPGDVPFACGWSCRREEGASVNLGVFAHSPHVGTHADAPLHVESGWPASEALPAGVFVGPCRVVALPEGHPVDEPLSVATLVRVLGAGPVTRLLLRTGHSVAHGAFPEGWPVLTVEAAEWLVARGLRLWGTDAPSADHRTSQSLPVHHALFAAGAFVLENLALDGVPPGVYELLAAPLLVHGADAAPVRALLRPPTFRG